MTQPTNDNLVESHIRNLPWSPEEPDHTRTLVAGNIRWYDQRLREKIGEVADIARSAALDAVQAWLLIQALAEGRTDQESQIARCHCEECSECYAWSFVSAVLEEDEEPDESQDEPVA